MSGPNAENETVQPMEIVAVPVSAPFQTLYLAEPVVVTSGNACVATGSAAVGIATGVEERRRSEHGSSGSRGSRGNIFSPFDGLRAHNCLWR